MLHINFYSNRDLNCDNVRPVRSICKRHNGFCTGIRLEARGAGEISRGSRAPGILIIYNCLKRILNMLSFTITMTI